MSVVNILMETFAYKNLVPKEEIKFSSWKVAELKQFLKICKSLTGLSNAKKEVLLEKVQRKWNEIIDSLSEKSLDYSSTSYMPLSPPMSPHSLLQISPPLSLSSGPCATSTTKSQPLTKNDFKDWKVHELQDFLAARCVNKTGNKEKLVKNAYGAYKLDLPVENTDPQEELDEIKNDFKKKLILENGKITLPNPWELKTEWVEAPINIPIALYDNVNSYLIEND